MPKKTHNARMDQETKDVIKMAVLIVVGLIIVGNIEKCHHEDEQRFKQELREKANDY